MHKYGSRHTHTLCPMFHTLCNRKSHKVHFDSNVKLSTKSGKETIESKQKTPILDQFAK